MKAHRLYTLSSLVKVFHGTKPAAASENRGSMLKNETFSFQVVIEGRRFGVEDVTMKFGGPLAPFLTANLVREIHAVDEMEGKMDSYAVRSKDSMYPELLEPLAPFSVKRKEYKSVFVTVKGDLTPGNYRIPITLYNKAGEEIDSCTYKLTVIDATLPETRLAVTHWMHVDSIAEMHGVKIYSDEYYAIFDKYLRAFVEMGSNMLLVPIFTLALDTAIGGERLTCQLTDIKVTGKDTYEFGFDRVKKYIEFAKARGIRFFEFSHLFTQWGAACCPKVVADVDGVEKKIFGWDNASDSPEYRAFLAQFLPALTAFIREMGLMDVSFLHLSDEPNEEHIDMYEKHYKFVKPLIGELRTFDALSHYEFYKRGVLDMPVPSISVAREFTAKGAIHFSYYCCGPVDKYQTNRFLVTTGERARVLGFQLYKDKNTVGFLHWGYNFYRNRLAVNLVNPFDENPNEDHFPSGDAYIVYPDVKNGGVMLSVRYAYIRDAFQDYRALMLLESLVGREAVENLLSDFGIYDFDVYPHSPLLVRMLREEINARIAKALEE